MSTSTYATTVVGEADYKGRRYAVLHRTRATFDGVRRDRTKLAFQDLSKEFWVDSGELSNCEKFPAPVDAEDYATTTPGPTTEERNVAYDRAQARSSSKGGFDDAYAQETMEIEAYCAHCGQRLTN